MDEIAEASQVSKQTVYSHFGTKDQLFVELVTAMTREAGDEVSAESALPETCDQVISTLESRLGHQLGLVLSPRLVRLRRLVISEVPRFPDLARAMFEQGPRRAVIALERVTRGAVKRRPASTPSSSTTDQTSPGSVRAAGANPLRVVGVEQPTDVRDGARQAGLGSSHRQDEEQYPWGYR